MRTTMTLQTLLERASDAELLDINLEIMNGVVPATSHCHSFLRKVNKMIDNGDLCINPTKFRKLYLPSLAREVQRELASRYTYTLLGMRKLEEYNRSAAVTTQSNHFFDVVAEYLDRHASHLTISDEMFDTIVRKVQSSLPLAEVSDDEIIKATRDVCGDVLG